MKISGSCMGMTDPRLEKYLCSPVEFYLYRVPIPVLQLIVSPACGPICVLEMKVLLLATLTAIARGAQPPQANTRTNTAHAAVSNITDVFIIPHTHADTGWMITAEEYYKQLVRPILDSQVRALASNASWRYCWAEIMYFARWWRDQSPAVRAQARRLAVAGQLEFVEVRAVHKTSLPNLYLSPLTLAQLSL